MKRFRLPLLSFAAAAVLIVAACSPSQRPPTGPALTPAGPVDVRVGTGVTFSAGGFAGPVEWAVNDVAGGAAATGTIAAGRYQAPTRVPLEPTVTVTATNETDPGEKASASVTITAPGTLYVFDTTVHVYGNLDTVGGNVAPDRSFTIAGTTSEFFDMTLAPALDMAFISTAFNTPRIFRLDNISTASGEVTGTSFSTLTYDDPGGMAYDHTRDTLYVILDGALAAYEGASTAPAGTEPTRLVAGPSLDVMFDTDNPRLALDVDADRVFFSNADATLVGIYDNASQIDGEVAPDRTITVDGPTDFFWGMAYDASRDQLYLGDQKTGVGVYVIANASTASGLVAPARSIGGPAHPIVGASQVAYDVANDRLVVIDADGDSVKIYDKASTLDGDVAPSRVIGGTQVPLDYPFGGYLDPTQ
ncbi:MAG: hypothetical protein ROY82_13035 [Truepera sp.]|jgi:hypothetical protein|nr:hypothetical protein [Truepera sp.]